MASGPVSLDEKLIQSVVANEVEEIIAKVTQRCLPPLFLVQFFDAISNNTSVRLFTLVTAFHPISFTSESSQSFSRWVATTTSLTTLDISFLKIGHAGAQILAGGLVQNTTLTSLDLRCNEMTSVGVIAIADAVRNHPSLCTLDLSNNDVRDDAAQSLSTLVATNSRLTRLKLSTHKMTDYATEALAAGIAANSTLTLLNLGSFEGSGAEKIIEAACVNTTLVSLQLKCDAGQGMRLEEIMTRNKQFREADFVFK